MSAAASAASGFQQTLATGPSDIALSYYQLNFFAQDEWRLLPNLSLSAGLRYEYNTPPRERRRRFLKLMWMTQRKEGKVFLEVKLVVDGAKLRLQPQQFGRLRAQHLIRDRSPQRHHAILDFHAQIERPELRVSLENVSRQQCMVCVAQHALVRARRRGRESQRSRGEPQPNGCSSVPAARGPVHDLHHHADYAGAIFSPASRRRISY